MEVAKFVEELMRKAERGQLLYIGENLGRIDDLDKVLGRPIYTADRLPDETLHIKLIHSTEPHAYIRFIDTSQASRAPKVLGVLTYRDVPGENVSSAIVQDRPLFAESKVRSTGDIVAAVVAEGRKYAEEAARLVKVDYTPLPAVFDPLEALKEGAPKVHEKGNLVRHFKVIKGDVEKGFAEADIIVENEFRTQFQDSVPMETEQGMAIPQGNKLTVIGSMQSPHLVRKAVARIVGMDPDDVRVIQAVTGGAFGPKSDETPYDVMGIAAIAALKYNRPAYCALTREDSMIIHTKRHPAIIRHRTGVKSDGRLTASKVEIYLDSGAYASLGVLVIMRATFHANGAYEIPHVRNDGYLVYTNNTYTGSFRGFGAPQAIFAAESQMDEIARKLNMDPLELRLINMLKPGRRTSTGQLMDESCGLPECVEKVVAASDFQRKWEEYSRQTGRVRRGIGMAILHHGNSLGPEGNDMAYITLRIEKDGHIYLGTDMTEFGTGAVSGVAQVAASILGVPLKWFKIEEPDTDKHGESGPTVASRTLTIGGRASMDAAQKLRERLNSVVAHLLNCPMERVAIVDGIAFDKENPERKVEWKELVTKAYEVGVKLEENGFYIAPECIWDKETGQGSPYAQYTFGAAVAEVEVDMETGLYHVTDYYVAFDVGRAINPQAVIGQLRGGSVQGMGYAMMEELIHEKGVILNPNLADYYIPTSMDIPKRFEAFIVEKQGPLGPFGAKIIAEPPIVLPAPAIRNALLNATGKSINSLPITPEKVLL